jgi:SAM-dependent methyltransferase
VSGVDLSESMISLAQSRRKQLPSEIAKQTHFQQGDVRQVDLHRQFDVVLSLFHVFSYLTTNDDLKQGFQTAHKHLVPGGLFLFDFWYGPAVLNQQPEVRTKELADDVIEVRRTARPEIRFNENIVNVNYELNIQERKTGKMDKVQEQHCMRYLFLPEVRQFLQDIGLELLFAQEWMTGHEPGKETWGVCCGGRKRGLSTPQLP